MTKRKGIVRSQPVTAFGVTGFTGIGFLSEGATKWLSFACAVATAVIRYLDTHGGLRGVWDHTWDRIWNGRT